MPTCVPTPFLASTSAHSANATPWLESAPRHLDARRSLLRNTAACTLEPTRRAHRHPLRAQLAASAHNEQLSIPILLPR
jgi:hypothetical protein